MTDRFILLGHPVAHSVSPAIHETAYRLLGRSGRYDLVDAPSEEDVARAVMGLRTGKYLGANVTVPWKQVALRQADRLDPSAERLGAANVLARAEDGAIVAYNTDALGLADELQAVGARAGVSPGTALVVGQGGAARAAAFAARIAGATRVLVTARRFDPETPQEEWPARLELHALDVELMPWPALAHEPLELARQSIQLVIQATSAGMHGAADGRPLAEMLDFGRFPNTVLAYDLVYNPPLTPFVELARKAGHVAESGLGMLVGQAVRAIEIWWGERPAVEPLRDAAARALGV